MASRELCTNKCLQVSKNWAKLYRRVGQNSSTTMWDWVIQKIIQVTESWGGVWFFTGTESCENVLFHITQVFFYQFCLWYYVSNISSTYLDEGLFPGWGFPVKVLIDKPLLCLSRNLDTHQLSGTTVKLYVRASLSEPFFSLQSLTEFLYGPFLYIILFFSKCSCCCQLA